MKNQREKGSDANGKAVFRNCRKKWIAWLTVILFILQPMAAAAQLAADPNAGANRPAIDSAANGTPLVQITSPSQAGVSHNKYIDFNVDPRGLILNNSGVNVQTQLGGYVAGNPFLANGSARVILNEVTSSSVSSLRGYTEVAGQRAEVVIANPNGITCDGCGFINASRGTLTTGTPVFGGAGSLEAFRVTGGSIDIRGTGLDASTAEQVDLISRAVRINAEVWGRSLNVITGANRVRYADLGVQVIPGEGNRPTVSLDVALLGGMYADKIRLIGTEAGLGVNSLGIIAAQSGDLVISQEGKVMLAGNTSAAGRMDIAAKEGFSNEGTLYSRQEGRISTEGDLLSNGTMAAGGSLQLTGATVTSIGTLGAGINPDGSINESGDLSVSTGGRAVLKGLMIAGGGLSIDALDIDIAESRTQSGKDAVLKAAMGDIDNRGGSLYVGGALYAEAQELILNDANQDGQAAEISARQITMTAKEISNRSGSIVQFGDGDTRLTATDNIDNRGGEIVSNGINFDLAGANIINSGGGTIGHAGKGLFTIRADGDLRNKGGAIASNGSVDVLAVGIDNTGASLIAQKGIDVEAPAITNTGGIIAGGEAVNIQTKSDFDNSGGLIEAGAGLRLAAQSLDNRSGQVKSLGENRLMSIVVAETIDDREGLIGGNGEAVISAMRLLNKGGRVTAHDDMTVAMPKGLDNTGGTIFTYGNLFLDVGSSDLTNNDGGIGSGTDLMITAGRIANVLGKMAADGDMTVTTLSMTNSGEVIAGRDLTISLSGDLSNADGAVMKANGVLMLTAVGTITNSGLISAVEMAAISGGSLSNEVGATIEANDFNLNVARAIINRGLMSGFGTMNIYASSFSNSAAVFADTLKITADSILNEGEPAILGATSLMDLYVASSLINRDGATIYSLGDIHIAGRSDKDVNGDYLYRTASVLNQSATIEAENDLVIYADEITNKKKIFVTGQAQVGDVTSHGVDMTGTPQYPKPPYMWATREYDETVTETVVQEDSDPGMLLAGRNMKIKGATLTNYVSTIAAGGSLMIDVSTLDNIGVGAIRIVTQVGKDTYAEPTKCDDPWPRCDWADRIVDYYSQYSETLAGWSGVISAGTSISGTAQAINNSMVNPNGSPAGSFSSTLPPGTITPDPAGSAPQTTPGGFVLPSNGLYHIYADPGRKYLVETDPRFVDYRTFLSSDYMLQRLAYNMETAEKRLGDGFYEQKLVRDQITQLTGRRYLEGYSSNDVQYRGLMENAVYYAKAFNLTVGIALTAEQMAGLTSDMVWLVEKDVGGQKVLAPVVYLSKVNAEDLRPTGALIVANDINLVASDTLTNMGTIKGGVQTSLAANTIVNRGGMIDSGNLTRIIASQDIINQSGTMTGGRVFLGAGRDIKHETLSESVSGGGKRTATLINDTAKIQSRGDLSAQAGRDVVVTGATVNVAGDASITAGRNLDIDTIQYNERSATNYSQAESTTHVASVLQTGGNLNLNSGNDAVLRGTQVTAGKDLNLVAGGNVSINAVKDSSTSTAAFAGKRSYFHSENRDEKVVGSNLNAGGNLLIAAAKGGDGVRSDGKGNVTIAGSSISSKTGAIGIAADRDITVKEETERHESLLETRTTGGGFLSSSTTETRDWTLSNLSRGNALSGESIAVGAGNDLLIRGSSLVATNDLILAAKNNIDITTSQETRQEEHMRRESKSGFMSSGGLGFTIGSQSQKSTMEEQGLTQVGSTIGSILGRVDIASGKDTRITGSDVISAIETSITGRNVTIDSAYNTINRKETFEASSSGLTIGIVTPGGIIETAMKVNNEFQRSQEVKDDRLNALYKFKAGRDLYKAGDEIKNYIKSDEFKKTVKDIGSGNIDIAKFAPTLTVSFGSSSSRSETVSQSKEARGSNIVSGGDIHIAAAGEKGTEGTILPDTGNLDVVGSVITGKGIYLTAGNDINLISAENTSSTRSSSSSDHGSIGVNISPKGVSATANVAMSRGNSDGDTLTHVNTKITADEILGIKSGRDTNMLGALAKGEKILAEIGHNLNMESRQDTDDFKSRNDSFSAGATVPITGGNFSANLSFSKGKVDSEYRSVVEQTGLYAGKGGYDIRVENNTDLKGAAIDSKADPEKNRLSTGTLTYGNIQNKAEYSASTVGISAGYGVDDKGKGHGFVLPNIGIPSGGSASSTTYAAISPGTIEIRSNPSQDISGLSRSPDTAHRALEKIFDAEKVAEQQELSRVFGEEAFKLVGGVSAVMGWEEGSREKVILHTITGAIQASLGGGNVLAGAVGAGAAEASRSLTDNLGKAQQQWISAAIGAAAGGIAGGGSPAGLGAGAATGLDGERYNRQLHQYEIDRAKLKAKEFKEWVKKEEGKDITEEEAEGRLMRQQLRYADSETYYKDGSIEDRAAYDFLKKNELLVYLKPGDFFDAGINQDVKAANLDSYAKGEAQRSVGVETPLDQNGWLFYAGSMGLLPSSKAVKLYEYARVDRRPTKNTPVLLSIVSLILSPVNLSLSHPQAMFEGTPTDFLLKDKSPIKPTFNTGFFPANPNATLLELISGTLGAWKSEYSKEQLDAYKSMQGNIYYDYDRLKESWEAAKQKNPATYTVQYENCQKSMKEVLRIYDQLTPKN